MAKILLCGFKKVKMARTSFEAQSKVKMHTSVVNLWQQSGQVVTGWRTRLTIKGLWVRTSSHPGLIPAPNSGSLWYNTGNKMATPIMSNHSFIALRFNFEENKHAVSNNYLACEGMTGLPVASSMHSVTVTFSQFVVGSEAGSETGNCNVRPSMFYNKQNSLNIVAIQFPCNLGLIKIMRDTLS